ncbi:uncharacterized protein LY89DRAFT_790625 [Mollisia scopiformis]|uniref:Transcription factor domain-containing protein n=1 Tax=Mollisia scopiformis TaxID=149040 RepID=A0A132B2S3_MOLSC|nr:uncharacterized protein LY89DRAFT_790625 [Mollisia scopiformis]KUJ06339.1 hypothetical protein LY89DRAFT_790625 [Mollisia scopiformis]
MEPVMDATCHLLQIHDRRCRHHTHTDVRLRPTTATERKVKSNLIECETADKMDFDLESFMSEVSQVLRHSSPRPTAGKRPSDDRSTTDDGESQDMDSSNESDENPIYSAAKRRRLDFTRRDSFQTDPSVSSDDDDDVASFQANDVSNDEMPSYFHPSLDMTTALVSAEPRLPPNLHSVGPEVPADGTIDAMLMYKERLDLVPNLYTYTVKSCLLPIRRVQTALVTLYFHHIHPMFPVVDEYHITELHRKYRGKEELMDPCDFTIYHAIMVAGFAHLSEAQARYWSQPAIDPVILTQISLILSLWSPGWIGPQNNSYWLDQAFKHASAGKLWEPQPSTRHCRRRLLWWCCLIRDRVLALGMRRPHRLHRAPLDDEVISQSDFGLEAKYPSYTDRKSKSVAVLAFIWFCKLSKIMEAIAVAQRRNKFSRDWDGESAAITAIELDEVNKLDVGLKCWLEEFEDAVAEATREDVDQIVWVPISTLRIMVHSLRAGLYQPYLHLPISHPSLSGPGIDPLQRMKDGARQVAMSVSDVMQNKKSDAIPTWLVAWVTLPVAVYHVNNRIRTNTPPDQILMPFLAQLVRRSSGAQMLLMTVRTATRDQIEKIARAEYDSEREGEAGARAGGVGVGVGGAGGGGGGGGGGGSGGGSGGGYKGFQFVHSRFSEVKVTRSTEARLLACVTRAVDEALEANGSLGVGEEG